MAGGKIPLGSRIVGIVDAFDAMISNRSYRRGLLLEDALERKLLPAVLRKTRQAVTVIIQYPIDPRI